MKFICSTLSEKSTASVKICSREWDLSSKIEAYGFFKLFMRTYIDYHNNISPLRKEQAECFKILIDQEEFVSDSILWSDVKDFKGLNGKYNNKIMYTNRNKSKTVVILNNHLTWYEALNSNFAKNLIDLHLLKFVNSSIKNYNFLTVTEDLTRINKNCMMYPSYFMEGVSDTLPSINAIIDEIKLIVPADEFYVYASCKNTLPSSILAGELGASKLYIQHGATSFINNPADSNYNDYSFLDANGDVILEQIMENVYFTTYIREQYFNIKDKFSGINDIFDVSNKYPNMEILYGYSKNYPELSFMEYWYTHIKSKSNNNITLTEFEHGDGESDLTNHWRLAKSFFQSK